MTLGRHRAETSEQARKEVVRWLNRNIDHCCMPGITDWFVVGGRWSGILSSGTLDPLRNHYQELGYEDDALLLTTKLYDTYLQPFERHVRRTDHFRTYHCGGFTRMGSFVDLDNELLSDDFIYRKWLIVTDCHS